MNRKIEQLTRNYLDSLYMSRYSLSDNQRERIIRINSQTNWIIFNRYSMMNQYSSGADATYEITSTSLQELLQEQLKVYHSSNWKDNFLTSDEEANSISLNDVKVKLLNIIRGGEMGWNLEEWVAINKTAMGESFGAVTMDINNVDLTIGTQQIKSAWLLNNLLNEDAIQNSTAPSSPNNDNNDGERSNPPPNDPSSRTNSSSSSRPQTNPSTPRNTSNNPPPTVKIDLTFTIDNVLPGYDFNPHFITLTDPFTLFINNQHIPIYALYIQSNDPNLASGNKVTIKNVEFGPGKAEVDPFAHDISIKTFFERIEKMNSTTGSTSSTPSPSSPPNPNPTPSSPTIYPEVQQKNRQIEAENDNLALLVYDLLEIIDKNNKLCQKAKKEKGLDLIPMLNPDGSSFDLTDFNNTLEKLDSTLPLNSSANQAILSRNQRSKQRKENFANLLKKTWQENQTKYQNAPSQPENSSPNSESSLKQKIAQIILQIEASQVDMNTLEGEKYRDYRSTLKSFSSLAEVENYARAILDAITQFKKNRPVSNSPGSSPNIPQPKGPLISEGERNILNATSLEQAQNQAIQELEKFLNAKGIKKDDNTWKNQIKEIKEIKEIWKFVRNYKRQVEAQLDKEKKKEVASPSLDSKFPLPLVIIPAFFIILLIVLSVVSSQVRRRSNKFKK